MAYGITSAPTPRFVAGNWFSSCPAIVAACNQAQIDSYVDFGMNLFVGVENPPLDGSGRPSACGANMPLLGPAGMRALVQLDERHRFNNLGPETAGWLLDDEADMQQGPGGDTANCTGGGYDVMRQANANAPNDGKARYANYGKGVGWWESNAQAQCFVNRFQDITSLDAYWMTDPNERPPAPPVELAPSVSPPGTVLAIHADGVDVACGEGALRLRAATWSRSSRTAIASFAGWNTGATWTWTQASKR